PSRIQAMRPLLLCILSVPVLCGCHTSTTRVESREQTVPVARDSATVQDYIVAIQSAPTPAAEADAIRSLRQWEISNRMTYRIRTIRTEDNAVIDAASVKNQPFRAHVTIYRGREVVRTFSFIPKDNRNLVLFGE